MMKKKIAFVTAAALCSPFLVTGIPGSAEEPVRNWDYYAAMDDYDVYCEYCTEMGYEIAETLPPQENLPNAYSYTCTGDLWLGEFVAVLDIPFGEEGYYYTDEEECSHRADASYYGFPSDWIIRDMWEPLQVSNFGGIVGFRFNTRAEELSALNDNFFNGYRIELTLLHSDFAKEHTVKYINIPHPCGEVATPDTQYTTVAYDWPYYDDFTALMDKANCLFEGTVRSIHFENCQIGSQTTMLCTFYEIEVQKRYCDTVSNVVMLRVEGGIQDAYLTEQLALTDQIPLVVGMPVLRVGDKRLFALYQAEDADFASLLNPVQSIYQTGDSAALHRGISPAELLPDAAASYRVLDRDKHISYVTDAPLPDEVCTVKDHVNDLMKRNKLPGSVWIYIKDGEMSVAAVCKNTSDWEILQAQVEQYGMPESEVPVIYDAIAYTCGDLNSDGTTNASDAANVLIAAANMGAGKDSGLTDAQFLAADFNFDGIVNASDAALILQQAAENGAKPME